MTLFISGLASLILFSCAELGMLYFIFGYEKRKKLFPFIFAAAACVMINCIFGLTVNSEDSTFYNELLMTCSSMILPYLLFKHEKKRTFALFGFCLCSTFDYIHSIIFSAFSRPTIVKEQLLYCLIYLLTIFAIFALKKLLKVTAKPEFLENISPVIYIVIFFADYSAYYKVMLTKDSAYYTEISNALTFLSSTLIVICFGYVFFRYTKATFKQRESDIILNTELKRYDEMMKKNRDIRAFRHDYQNNLFSIKTFIKDGRIEEAENYIDEINSSLAQTSGGPITGNYLADAIISEKSANAKDVNVSIEFSGSIPPEGIGNYDLCTILANLIDNAVRAAAEVSPCTVNIDSCEKNGGVVIKISNPIKDKVTIKNNTIQSTKRDRENHGFGLQNVKKAVQKYDGYVEISCNDIFVVEVGLMLNTK